MKIIPIGVNSAFATGEYYDVEVPGLGLRTLYDPKWQSNFIIEVESGVLIEKKTGLTLRSARPGKPLRILVDCGGDARHGLKRFGLTMNDFDIIYISHPHSDHIGGIECSALSTFFNPFYNQDKLRAVAETDNDVLAYVSRQGLLAPHHKPILLGESEVLKSVWQAFEPGLDTLQGVRDVTLKTYFNVIRTDKKTFTLIEDNNGVKRYWDFYTVESTHVIGGTKHMPSFGLFFKGEKKIFLPTDTMLLMPPTMITFYNDADIIYQDTEVGVKTFVHSHIDEIEAKASPELKKKMYLYHYGQLPDIDESKYAGILRLGDVHVY